MDGGYMVQKTLFWFGLFSCISTCAFGGGTVFDGEVTAILEQQPQLAGFVRTELEFCKASWFAATRLAGNYPLGGKRLGPYERRIRPKGSENNFDFVLTVNTFYTGLNDKGMEVDIIEATRIDEKISSIEIRFDECKEDWCKASPPLAPAGPATGDTGRK